jgi:LuxR family transcriptional regulator, maltose regulon positive regulatory protein
MIPAPLMAPAAVSGAVLSEQALAAASLGLLAQTALWSSLPLAPEPEPAEAPWTTYWATRLDPRLEPLQARARLAAAFEAHGQRGDRIGELACLAAIIEGFYVDEGPLEPLDGWIAALAERLPQTWPSAELEAHVMACGVGILLRAPQHPLLARWAERGAALMRQIKPGAGRLKLATFVAQYHFWRGEFSRTALIVDALPGLDVEGLLPGEALVWLETVANHARCAGEPRRGHAAIEQALRLLRQHRMTHHVYALHAHGASLALAAGDADLAQVHLDAMRPVLDSRPQADQTHYWHFQAGLSLARGDARRAVELARAAMSNAGEIGGPFRSAMQSLSLGQALLRAGEPAPALAAVEQALANARPIDATLVVFTAELMRAACLLRLGDAEGAAVALREGWGEGARRDFATTASWWLPEQMAELAQAALARGIEPAYVRRFVRRHALAGPDPALADWPWPLQLRAFGAFEALLNDAPLTRSSGKTAQRPLDLLRALLAHGAGLPAATAMQWLWPEADVSARRKAFDVALLRLRRTLGDARLLHLEGGRLWLDERWTWSDVAALQALLQQIGSAGGAPLAQLQRWAQQLLDLMRGPFLAGDDSDWVRAAREKYRRRFVVAVAQLAAEIEPLDAPAAVRLYERALDVEPLAESLSRRLMRLHAERGERAEALRVWRACRTMLRVAEGLEPARETQALAAKLGLADT